MTITRLGVFMMVVLGLAVIAPPPGTRGETPAELRKTFPSTDRSWTVSERGYGGAASDWTYAPSISLPSEHFSITARIHLESPATRRDGMELGAYAVYRAHADLRGYEAALAVHYHGPEKQYRCAVSSLWKELVLWKPSGGIVQVVPYPFEMGKTYEIRITCQGPRLTVAVDGQPQIDWRDTADPITGGSVALCRQEGTAWFLSGDIRPASATAEPAVSHVPRFSERRWHDLRWFFDGHEPLFVLRDDNVLDHMKLRPGYRAAMYAFNFITDWGAFYPKKIEQLRVVETGSRLRLETVSVDPDQPGGIRCQSALTVTYEPSSGMYAYDHACRVGLTSEQAALVGGQWDHGDAVFLGSVGSAKTRAPTAEKPHYLWSVFETPDRKLYKVPHNHNGHFLGRSSNNGGPIRSDGGRVVAVGDPMLSPVIEIAGKSASFDQCSVGLCWWAYDVHTIFAPKLVEGRIAPGDYSSRVRYSAVPGSEGQKLLEQATFFEPLDTSVRVPVYTGGVGAIESFDKEVLLASPHPEHRIWAGTFDRQIGHGDTSSLRLDGPTEAWTLTGPSYFSGNYGKKNRVTAWVKTRDVGGDGPAIGFRRLDNNTVEFHTFGVRGTHDWTPVSFITDFPGESFGAMILFRNAGSGSVWLDDFCIEPLPGDDPAAVSPAWQPSPTADSDRVLAWSDWQHTAAVLDTSGYGHHGRIFGSARAEDEDGRRILHLDGATAYLWPLPSPSLVFGPNTTVLLEIKPEAAGVLVSSGFRFTLSTSGSGDEHAVEYRAHGGPPVRSRPFLKKGEWQHLGVVMTADQIRLYRNGQFMEALPVPPVTTDWSLHQQSTWHRRISLFGMGPGDMALLPESPAYGWKGMLRSVEIYRRALRPEELTERGARPPLSR